jgi:hypothetical protein
MTRRTALAILLALSGVAAVAHTQIPVPEENRADLTVAPPRPGADEAQEPARRLFDAILHDQPERAADFFFPREAFVLVKAMARPERYHARLARRFEADIHALHQTLATTPEATFERLELTRRGAWVRAGEEGNRLPYWAARHARLHYRVGQQKRALEVRVLISWGSRWYVIHLGDF